jgi:hypothetical protein
VGGGERELGSEMVLMWVFFEVGEEMAVTEPWSFGQRTVEKKGGVDFGEEIEDFLGESERESARGG